MFSLLDPKELELGFRSWIQDICGKYKGIVNIDGKEICGAKEEKRNGSFDSLRMVSAWSSENGVSLGQERVDKKSNEIKAIPKLIESLDLQGCIVTIDAIGCQHEIVKEVTKAHADYLICVKSNQKTLYKTITSWFDEIDMEGNKVEGHGHIPSTRYQMAYKEEKRAHGREEKRFCQVYNNGCTAAVLSDKRKYSYKNRKDDNRETLFYYLFTPGFRRYPAGHQKSLGHRKQVTLATGHHF